MGRGEGRTKSGGEDDEAGPVVLDKLAHVRESEGG